jgi:hypothetical protein
MSRVKIALNGAVEPGVNVLEDNLDLGYALTRK